MPLVRLDDFVAPAIQSVLAQQGVDVELVMLGPAETEPDFEKLQGLINTRFAGDSRCVLIPRKKQGIANALNEALKQATSDYIARMDGDDLCEPQRLLTQLTTARRYNDQCLVSARVKIFSTDNAILQGNQQYESWLNNQCTPDVIRNACLIESPLPHPSWFAHKSVWKTIAPYQQGDFPEDYDLVLSAWLHNIPMVKPDTVLLHWREHANRLTYSDTRYRRQAFTQLKAKALSDSRSGLNLDQGRAVWIAGTGRNARDWHDALQQHHVQVAGFVDFEGPKAKQQKRNKPVVTYQSLAHTLKDDLLVTAITNHQGREQLVSWSQEQGWAQGTQIVIGG